MTFNTIILFSIVTKTIFLRQISTSARTNGLVNQKKFYNNEFFTCFTGNTISALIGYRQRVRLFFNCAVAYALRMGAGCYRRIGYFEQPELKPPLAPPKEGDKPTFIRLDYRLFVVSLPNEQGCCGKRFGT